MCSVNYIFVGATHLPAILFLEELETKCVAPFNKNDINHALVLRGVSDSVVWKSWRNTLSSWAVRVIISWVFAPNCTSALLIDFLLTGATHLQAIFTYEDLATKCVAPTKTCLKEH